MENKNSEDMDILDYLYGELSPYEAERFRQEIAQHPELKNELSNLLQLRHLSQKHLSEKQVPAQLSKKVLSDLGIRRPWHELITKSFFRPALAAAFTVAFALGIGYHYWDRPAIDAPHIAQNESISNNTLNKKQETASAGSEELELSDILASYEPRQPRLQMPTRQQNPWQGSQYPVTVASLGNSNTFPSLGTQDLNSDVQKLEQEADLALARFFHTQGLKLRAMGQHRDAARHFATVLKKYPQYPLKDEVLAQRVDCLFAAGDYKAARRELAWLYHFSPELAGMVQQRWIQ